MSFANAMVSAAARRPWLCALALTVLALAVRIPHLDAQPHFDELYHFYAAQGWLAHGEYRVLDGIYSRAAAYTKLVAALFAQFGASIEVLRWPSVLSGAALVGVAFLFVQSVAGNAVALCCALLLAFWPDGIMVAKVSRFYALHGLAYWLGACFVYLAATATPGRYVKRASAAIVACACFALALHLHISTAVGLVGVMLWVGGNALDPRYLSRKALWRFALLVLVIVAVFIVSLTMMDPQWFDKLSQRYRWTPMSGAALRDEFWYYHKLLVSQYPSFWPLSVFAACVGLAVRPRLTGFCLFVGVLALFAHSFGGPKNPRYVYYVMPFLFVIWSIAAVDVVTRSHAYVATTMRNALRSIGWQDPPYALSQVLLGCTVIFAVLTNAAATNTIKVLLKPPFIHRAQWQDVHAQLHSRVESASVVVTPNEMPVLHVLGRVDVTANKNRMSELRSVGGADLQDFARDPRTGLPVITSGESFAQIVACNSNGIFLTSAIAWRNSLLVDDALADSIERLATRLTLTQSARILAFAWEHSVTASAKECEHTHGFDFTSERK